MRTSAHRRGFTLIELVLGLTVMSLLVAGLGSAMLISARALPDGSGTAEAAAKAADVADVLASELYCATAFTLRQPHALEFTIPDRNGDGNPELVRYEWSGVAGAPLLRAYNNATPVELAPAVYEFVLSYDMLTESRTTIQQSTEYGDEQLLAYFDGWLSLLPSLTNLLVDNSNWAGQYFEVTPPAGADRLRFTRARVLMALNVLAPKSFTVGIHRSKNDGSYQPAATPIGLPTSIPGNLLSSLFLWVEASFNGVEVTDLAARKDFVLLLSSSSTTSVLAQSYSNLLATNNGTILRWTSNAGLSWNPASNALHRQDLRYYVYGSYGFNTSTEVTVNRYLVRGIGVTLRTHPDAGARVRTATQVLNAPGVMTP